MAVFGLVACVSANPFVEIHGESQRGPAYTLESLSYEIVDEVNLAEYIYGTETLENRLTNAWLNRDPDEDLNATQIIARWGYPVETHVVTTEDGYILGKCIKCGCLVWILTIEHFIWFNLR